MHTSKARRRIAAGLLTTLALAGSALVTEPASAATTQDVVYSTDGGTTWTTTPTVAPGATVLVRQWFDNTDDLHATAASETTTLPTGFTPTGTTQVCLNPSTTTITSPNGTELQCATADSGAVWSDTSLTISPTAGLFGQPATDTSGILAAGRKRYLSLDQCRWTNTTDNRRASILIDTADFTTNTGAGNATTTSSCVKVTGAAWTAATANNALTNYSLFARRYVNLHQCRWRTGVNNIQAWNQNGTDTDYRAYSNTSNSADTAVNCTPGLSFPFESGPSGVQALDVLTNRYLNLHQCRWADPGSDNRLTAAINTSATGNYVSGTNASNTPDATRSCTTPSNWSLDASSSGLQVLDLLDTSRGKGYVEYSMTAPAEPTAAFCDALDGDPVTAESFTQNTALTSSAGTAPATGTLSVDWTQLTDPCPDDIGNLIDPGTGLLTAGTLALAGAGVATYRRRRTTLA
ncbi:MAG: hypothetical protein KF703_12925 [Actinobacteria bacterium]|nr:hypothetical protein [Actinomycetota bacterium]